MPLRAEVRQFYGPEWRAYRAALIASRGAQCSACGRDVPKYLNLAHVNHDQRSGPVALLCPACHSSHDTPQRVAMTRRSAARSAGQLWLLPEIEWSPYPLWALPAEILVAAQTELFA